MITASDFQKWLSIFNVPTSSAPAGPVSKQEVQQSAFNFSTATGADDAFVVTLDPAIVNLTDGLLISFSSAYTNLTATPTLQVNALSPVSIVINDGGVLAPGDIQANNSYLLEYSLSNNNFQLLNPSFSAANTFLVQENAYNFAIDSGTTNAIAIELLPIPQNATAGAFPVFVQLANTNTGATTVSINSGSPIPIITQDGAALVGGEMVFNYISYLLYNPVESSFVLQNSALPTGVTPTQIQEAAFVSGVDSGTADVYIVTLDPSASFTEGNGTVVSFSPLNANLTTSPTLAVNGNSALPILLPNNTAVSPGDIATGSVAVYVVYSNGVWLLMNPLLSFGGDTYAESVSLINAATTSNFVVSDAPETVIDMSMLLVSNSSMNGTYPNATIVNLSNLQQVTGDFNMNFPNATGLVMDQLTTVSGQFGLQLNVGTTLSLNSLASTDVFSIVIIALTTLSLPAYTTCNGNFGGFMPTITTLSLPVLATLGGTFTPRINSLTTISLPSILNITGGIIPQLPHLLTTFSLNAGLLSVGGDVLIVNAALDQASVDGILVSLATLDGTGGTTSYDTHTVDLSGGTSSTPSATGLAAKATLVGRGNTVNTN